MAKQSSTPQSSPKYKLEFMFEWGNAVCVWSANEDAKEKFKSDPIGTWDLPISQPLKDSLDELFIEENLRYGNEEDIAEIYNPVRDGLNTLAPYLESPNDGTISKGHIENLLKSFFPMFNFDNFIANIEPEVITLDDGEISFQCSDNFDNEILCGAYGVIDEELSITDWHNF